MIKKKRHPLEEKLRHSGSGMDVKCYKGICGIVYKGILYTNIYVLCITVMLYGRLYSEKTTLGKVAKVLLILHRALLISSPHSLHHIEELLVHTRTHTL